VNWGEVLIRKLQTPGEELTEEKFRREVTQLCMKLRDQMEVYGLPSDSELQKIMKELKQMEE